MTVRSERHACDRLNRFAVDTTMRLRGHVTEQCPGESVVHAGFCAHANPGDNAISIAESRVIRAAGKRVRQRYSDLSMMHSPESVIDRIAALPGRPPIVLSGGGFLTGLYPEILDACSLLIREFADRPILVMPQSSRLDDGPVSRAFVSAVRSHPRIRLLGRDQATFDELRHRTASDVWLAPDSVLTFGTNRRRFAPGRLPVAVVARRDGEVATGRGPVPSHPVLPWMTEPRAFRDPRLLPARGQHRGIVPRAGSDLTMWAAARGRTARAMSMVRSTRLLLADRLHAVILALVNQTPVVAVDNSYGKISGAIDTWNLAELGPVRMAATFPEAEELGNQLERDHRAGDTS